MKATSSSNNRKCVFHSDSDNFKTMTWWTVLTSIALLNCALWTLTYQSLMKNDNSSLSTNRLSSNPYTRYHLILSGIYTFVCSYRSLLPRIDLERICLFDTQWSSIFLGRASATIAEVSFGAQLALFLQERSHGHNHVLSYIFSYFIVPLLTTAQGFCWYGLLSQNHLSHAIEESIWAFTIGSIGICLIPFIVYQSGHVVWQALLGVLMSIMYCTFMLAVDVPMYLTRWRENNKEPRIQMKGKQEYHFSVGISKRSIYDSWERRVVTKDWKVWKSEVSWLTGYFSFAVWTSIALCHFPSD